MRKILALDLDGTLTNSEKKITSKTKEKLIKIMEEGHVVVLASGRPTPGVKSVAEELELKKYGGYTLSYNGGKITDCKTGEVIYQKTLKGEIVEKLFRRAEELDIGIMTYDNERILAGTKHDEYMELEARINSLDIYHVDNISEELKENPVKCLGTAPVEIAPDIEKQFRREFGDEITVGRSEPFFIELLPKGIDKADSLEKLLNHLGSSRENLIACGDGFNDISMIKYAGVGVAMENAQDVVKEVADYITLSNDEDGVAKVIDEYIL